MRPESRRVTRCYPARQSSKTQSATLPSSGQPEACAPVRPGKEPGSRTLEVRSHPAPRERSRQRLAGTAADDAREAPLPHIDEHWIEVAAPAERIWEMLEQVVVGATGGSAWTGLYAAAVGAQDLPETGCGLATGATLVGFHVVAADPPREVLLEGAQRLARSG